MIIELKNGIKINYEYRVHEQDDVETLVFVNGTFSVLQDWEGLAEEFYSKGGYNVLIFDMRNQGGSTKVEEAFEYKDVLEDFELLIEQLGLEKFNIITYSSGSAIGVDYAYKHKEKVNKLIMGAPAVNVFGGFKLYKLNLATIRALELGGMSDLFQLCYPLMFSNNFSESNASNYEVLEEEFVNMYDANSLLLYMNSWQTACMSLDKLKDVFSSIESHFICGEEDYFNPPVYLNKLKEEIDSLNIHIFNNVGHGFNMEDMDGYLEILKSIV